MEQVTWWGEGEGQGRVVCLWLARDWRKHGLAVGRIDTSVGSHGVRNLYDYKLQYSESSNLVGRSTRSWSLCIVICHQLLPKPICMPNYPSNFFPHHHAL